jgi:ATP-dependent Clp protease ATP-binding subunit ClpA
LELAVEESRRLGHAYIGTEHLLLGICREGEGIAAAVLQSLGITIDRARATLIQILAESGPGPKSNVVMCRLDNPTLAAVDSLIEAGIRTTRSDAVSWLVKTGIEANRPLFERIGDTVAEIRRLREEARQLAQQTPADQPAPASQPPISADGEVRPTSASSDDPAM